MKILDCTWGLEKRDYEQDFLAERIPGSSFFDIDKVADTSVNLPHMLPSVALFEKKMSEFGVNRNDFVVVYDRSNNFVASARVWWTLRVFEHPKVAVLNGGLKKWKKEGLPLESGKIATKTAANYKGATFKKDLVKNFEEMKKLMGKKTIVDARPAGRQVGEHEKNHLLQILFLFFFFAHSFCNEK